jgi:hypothetical protein
MTAFHQIRSLIMSARRSAIAAVAFASSFVVLLADVSPAQAQSGDRVRLFASMSSAGAGQAKAKYELISNVRRKFSIEIEKAVPGQVLTVSAGGTAIGTMTVGPFGNAKLERDTRLGETVPVLNAGTVIEVQSGGSTLMSGQLR